MLCAQGGPTGILRPGNGLPELANCKMICKLTVRSRQEGTINQTIEDEYPVSSVPHTLPQQGPAGGLALATALLAGAGAALWLYLNHLTGASLFQSAPSQALPGIIALATLPLLANGLRRKLFFGQGLSLHQALSFECIFQLARWVSPLLSSRRFQTAFHMRETGQEQALALSWQETQLASLPASASLAATLWLVVSGHPWSASAALVCSIGAFTWGHKMLRQRVAQPRAYLATCLTSVLLWSAEAMVFAWASHGMLPGTAAMGIWLAVALLSYRPALPLGLGLVQLPALLVFGAGLADVALLLLSNFLVFRLATLAALGLIYLSRYKLRVTDLFNNTIVGRIISSQRPRDGWPVSPDVQSSPYTLSIVIPAFQEALRLPPYLASVQCHMRDKMYPWEIIVVDDGSTDKTMDSVKSYQSKDSRTRVIRLEKNAGKGAAVARGVEEARGHYVIFADADGSTPATQIDKLMAKLESGSEIAVGSRVAQGPGVVRDRYALRQLLGTLYYRLVNFFAVPGVGDTQCGFKGFRRDVARRLFTNLGERRWAFDVEVLYRAQLLGYAITEVPIQWHEVAGSKLRPVVEGSRMARAIFRIRRKNTGFFKQESSRRMGRQTTGTRP